MLMTNGEENNRNVNMSSRCNVFENNCVNDDE